MAAGVLRFPRALSKKYAQYAEEYESFEKMTRELDAQTCLQTLQIIDLEKVDNEHLRRYLLRKYEEIEDGIPTTLWAKALCIYDAIAFGPLREMESAS